MVESRDESPNEDYFNDLTQQTPVRPDAERQNSREDNGEVPKPRRIACVLCRKRKLRCDGNKPVCGTCTRLQHTCSYDEVRRKSGPKRGYVKALEARLAQVETLLKTQDEVPVAKEQNSFGSVGQTEVSGSVGLNPGFGDIDMTATDDAMQSGLPDDILGDIGLDGGLTASDDPFPWEMIGLGLDEPLPNQDVIDELNQLYFEKIHPSGPMMHRPRYYAAMSLAPHMRPPICLRYAMWCCAAAVSDKYEPIADHFYQRARKYIQQDELRGHGESMITVAHCQTWILLASYEFKLMYFPRAWVSSGRGTRLAQMMGLHRLDGSHLDVKQCLPPCRDWTETEERRRTFWGAFCVDRYASIGTGWPMTIDERDISSHLPADDQAFENNRPARMCSLSEAMEVGGPATLSSFGGVILMACLFGRNLHHLHRPTAEDKDDDMNGEFWKRHRHLDNILLNTALALPENLRLPAGLHNPNVIFMTMNIHTSAICLHQAAIFKADQNRMASHISAESKKRCITSAAEIANVMKQISHLDIASMNPFISFCLYVAARVFVQYLKSRPEDDRIKTSLQFLLSAMHAIKRRNPLTESFIVQLDVDLDGANLDVGKFLRSRAVQAASSILDRGGNCTGGLHNPPQRHNENIKTFGDGGVTSFADSSHNGVVAAQPEIYQADRYPCTDEQHVGEGSRFHGIIQIDLPNRQRSPGSSNASRMFQSDMDASPDSNGMGNRTGSGTSPSSDHGLSTRTSVSTSGFSPPMHQQQQQQQQNQVKEQQQQQRIQQGQQQQQQQQHLQQEQMNGGHLYGASDAMFSPNDFDISRFVNSPAAATIAHHQASEDLTVPQTWTPSMTIGIPPSGAPATMMAGPGLTDVIGMSEAEWNQVMENFPGWDQNLAPADATTASARRGM